MKRLFFDRYDGLREWVNVVLILLVLVGACLFLGFLIELANQWSCNAWASSNPDLEIKYFWDGLLGCMVKVDGTWIDSALVREILSLAN